MTPAWGAHLSCFSRFAEVTGSVPEDFHTRPVGNAKANAFPTSPPEGGGFSKRTSALNEVEILPPANWGNLLLLASAIMVRYDAFPLRW